MILVIPMSNRNPYSSDDVSTLLEEVRGEATSEISQTVYAARAKAGGAMSLLATVLPIASISATIELFASVFALTFLRADSAMPAWHFEDRESPYRIQYNPVVGYESFTLRDLSNAEVSSVSLSNLLSKIVHHLPAGRQAGMHLSSFRFFLSLHHT